MPLLNCLRFLLRQTNLISAFWTAAAKNIHSHTPPRIGLSFYLWRLENMLQRRAECVPYTPHFYIPQFYWSEKKIKLLNKGLCVVASWTRHISSAFTYISFRTDWKYSFSDQPEISDVLYKQKKVWCKIYTTRAAALHSIHIIIWIYEHFLRMNMWNE